MPRKLAMCFHCDHVWLTKWDPIINAGTGIQCPKCMKSATHLVDQYKKDISDLRNQLTKDEAIKFAELIKFLKDKDYLINFLSKEPKLNRLLEELIASY